MTPESHAMKRMEAPGLLSAVPAVAPASSGVTRREGARMMSVLRAGIADYLALTKPRIAALVLITTMVGYLAAGGAEAPLAGLLHVLIGTALAAAGANALNQYLERSLDARMDRTASRPIPSGRIAPKDGLRFGLFCAVGGSAYLFAAVNPLCAGVVAATLLLYLGVYTPLKRVSPWCTVVGAVPGALPPIIGWTAATGAADARAWTLFLILFVWQIPHFWAIAWLYRDDYRAAGFPMLPVLDADGRRTGRQIVLLLLFLIPLAATPWYFGMAGRAYLLGAALLGLAFFATGTAFHRARSPAAAQRLVLASVAYLPLLWGLLLLDG